MPFPEGMGDMRISGAKRVLLVGEPADPLAEVQPLPAAAAGPKLGAHKAAAPTPRGRREQPAAGRQRSRGEQPRAAVSYVSADDPTGVIAPPHRRFIERELEANVKPWQRGGMHFLTSTNIFGLSSKSELNYPELYKPIEVHFWRPLTLAEQADLITRQAAMLDCVGYRENAELQIAYTAADEAYNEASSRRNAVLRKRFRGKKRGYQGKKEEEEWRRQAPLSRRFIEPERRYAGATSIVRGGALETPVIVSGLPVLHKDASGLPQYQEPPPPLRVVKRRKKTAAPEQSALDYEERGFARYELPTFETCGVRTVKVQPGYKNVFGLTPREITAYPEAYRDVSAVYWRQLNDEQRQQIMQVQAVAMEKVGFERGTSKHFIDDFEPAPEAVYAALVREMTRPPTIATQIGSGVMALLLTIAGIAIVVGLIALAVIFVWDWLLSFAGM